MRSTSIIGVVLLLMSLAVLAAACSSGGEEPTAVPTPVFNPTAAPASTAAAGHEAQPTPRPSQPTPTAAPAGGDAANGKVLFTAKDCSACHSTGHDRIVGPGLAGTFERAASTVAGESAAQYLEQSIRNPSAYIVEGFPDVMPAVPGLSASDIADLIAYLKTLN